ncbi:MAG: hypothetical protein JWL97_3838 [Gemmatimonadales bacterium]|jgi:hypothetical protein|nr:hypothetical protein [Gemmatimonadales bacterium]
MSSWPPVVLDGATVKLFAQIGAPQRPTGATRHSVDRFDEMVANLAIVQYQDGPDCYLFYCTSDWEVVADTCHPTEEEAIAQAEFEFTNSSFVPVASGRP